MEFLEDFSKKKYERIPEGIGLEIFIAITKQIPEKMQQEFQRKFQRNLPINFPNELPEKFLNELRINQQKKMPKK